MSNSTVDYYNKNVERLSQQYESLSFNDVHSTWLPVCPDSGIALDVGCGSGRDAYALAEHGFRVVAVDPAEQLLNCANRKHSHVRITWLQDGLPSLSEVFRLQMKFDLILLSAVWMHIAPSNRNRSFRKLAQLLKPSGKMVITLRHGNCDDGRQMHSVSKNELAELANLYGLTFKLIGDDNREQDKLGRKEVWWETVVLELPDDGSGAFPLLRNIVVNDSKSPTYKVALIRTLLRIAEGQPGAVLGRDNEFVELPLGLVALYWLKLFKPLVDQYEMQQSSNSSKGLGFIKENGWKQLTMYTAADFNIGAVYSEKLATAIHKTLKEIGSTIKKMPAHYITLPGTKQQVFGVEPKRTANSKEELTIDISYLSSLGSFFVPVAIWDALVRFSVWIEPALVNEWVNLMASYSSNKERNLSTTDYLNALTWDDAERTTVRVRKRIEQLINEHHSVYCIWSMDRISNNTPYDVDHCFPFARWPNNDLWNLLPAKSSVNSQKSDRLPSAQRFQQSKSYIIDWWKMAWTSNETEFFTQANLSLPRLGVDNRSFSDVFEGFALQRDRILDIHQLREW